MSAEQLIRVKVGNDEVSYTMRGLKNDEVDDWTEFCASVFAYKANPPPASYFGRHFYNDPERSASLIRVMIYNGSTADDQDSTTTKPQIVSSCRIFRRTISLGGGSIVVGGGIGEVCTDNDHRRRGLSKMLLQDAIRIMTEQNHQLSLLHAAPAFFPVYESSGYVGTTSCWSLVSIFQEKLSDINVVGSSVRLAEFPADTDRLQILHRGFTEEKFCGTIVRTKAYWNDYLSKELEKSLWVLTDEAGLIVAWLSIRSRGERIFQLCDFGCDLDVVRLEDSLFATYFGSLLYHAARDMVGNEKGSSFNLHFPTKILDGIRKSPEQSGFVDWKSETNEDDHGWMYRTLPSSNVTQENIQNISEQFPHLIWPADSF